MDFGASSLGPSSLVQDDEVIIREHPMYGDRPEEREHMRALYAKQERLWRERYEGGTTCR
jgi:hypothetical protein